MKYIVEVEEWENQQKTWRNFGNREALNFIENTVRLASWNDLEEMKLTINRYLSEHNPTNDINSFWNRKANPMLSIISHLRAFLKMINYFEKTNPEKLKEFYKEK